MPPYPIGGGIDDSPSNTFGSSVAGVVYGPVAQPCVHGVDVQRRASMISLH